MNLLLAMVIALAPATPTPPPSPHANPDLEYLCDQPWYISNHYGLCLNYNS